MFRRYATPRKTLNERAEVRFGIVLLCYNRCNCCFKLFTLLAQTRWRKNIIALHFGKGGGGYKTATLGAKLIPPSCGSLVFIGHMKGPNIPVCCWVVDGASMVA